MTNFLNQRAFSMEQSAVSAAVVTPNDDADLPHTTRGLLVTVEGTVAVHMFTGETLTLLAVPAYTVLPLCVNRVLETTTATVVALY